MLNRKMNVLTADDVKEWYNTSQRKGKREDTKEREQRLIRTYLKILNDPKKTDAEQEDDEEDGNGNGEESEGEEADD